MREGLKLSSGLFMFGLLILFKQLTFLEMDFLTMSTLIALSVYWCDGQLKNKGVRTIQWITLGIFVFYTLSAFMPFNLFTSAGAISSSLFYFDRVSLKEVGANAFLQEAFEYLTDPNKLDFYHWQYLWLIFVMSMSELLYQIHRKNYARIAFLFTLVVSGLLWFTYLDVWVIFTCFFLAYAMERLTRNGKGALFGLVLPIGVVVSALLATNLTPVESINEKLSPLTSENGWIRTAFNLSPGSGIFQLSEMGFYPLGDRLGGPVKLSKEVVFRINSQTPNLYLRGRVLTLYEDSQWKLVEHKNKPFYTQSPQPGDAVHYELYDLNFDSNTVFAPMSISKINLPLDKLTYGSNQEVIYEGSLLATAKKGYEITANTGSIERPSPQLEYLQLPKNYSKAVVSLTQEVIRGAKTDEDRVKKIRKYLLNNYQYALAVEMPPEKQDFVEYFLTEADAGYCVYFASATVVMSRIAGLPSRYVEGFVTPETLETDKGTPVSGERAHAWAEIYYNNQWQIVETTPTFTRLSDEEVSAPIKSDLLEPQRDIENLKKETDLPMDLPVADDKQTSMWKVPIWLWGVVFVLMLLGMFSRLRFKAYFRDTSKLLCEKYVRLLLLGLSRHFELSHPEVLTPRQIIITCDQYAPSLNLRALIEIVEKSLYDSSDINDEALARLAEVYWKLFHENFSWASKIYWYAKIVIYK